MKFKTGKEDVGQRLDKFLVGKLKMSRSQIQQAIKNGLILVNEKNVLAHYFLKIGDVIVTQAFRPDRWAIRLEKSKKIKPTCPSGRREGLSYKIKVVVETPDYLIINKPAGLLVHPTERLEENTLVAWLLKKYPRLKSVYDKENKNGKIRPGIVHRLDRDVAGLMVVAKTQKMFNWLKQQFQERQVKKIYTALVYGRIEPETGVIKRPLARSKKTGLIVARTSEDLETKTALTEFEVIKRFKNYTLLKITLKTGRTHQIRVHLKSIGHSIVGDNLYQTRDIKLKKNKPVLSVIFLCATQLGFADLTNNWQEYKIKLPKELNKFLAEIK